MMEAAALVLKDVNNAHFLLLLGMYVHHVKILTIHMEANASAVFLLANNVLGLQNVRLVYKNFIYLENNVCHVVKGV